LETPLEEFEIYPTFLAALGRTARNLPMLAAIYLPFAVASSAFLFVGAPTFADPPEPSARALNIPPSEWIALAGWMLFSFSVGAWSSAALFRAVAEGRGFASAYGAAIERVPAVLGAQLLYGLALVGGLMCCFVPGLWVLVRFLPALPRAATRDVGPLQAMRESLELERGRAWKCAGYLVLVMVAIYSALTPYLLLSLLLPHGDPVAHWTRMTANIVCGTLVAVVQAVAVVALHERLEATRA
jgi:hypothetical protein